MIRLIRIVNDVFSSVRKMIRPIKSRSTKRVDVLRCAVHPPARLVHGHLDPHVEDGAVAVAVAEHADEEAVLHKKV